jgi:hypothetical protein
MIRNVFCYNSTSPNKGVSSPCYSAYDGSIGSDCCAFLDQSRPYLIHLANFSPGIVNIGKDHGRAAKNSVFKGHTFIYTDVVLYLALFADGYIRAYYHVLADVAIFPYVGAGENMGEVPDLRFFADGYVFIYLGGRMNKEK